MRFCPLPFTANTPSANRKYGDLLHGIGAYKRKLQEQGLINSIDDQIYDAEPAPADQYQHFNELEMLQLIPVIIGELQARRIDDADQQMLHSVFGSLWQLMVDEAERRQRRRAARSMDGSSSREDERQQPPIDPVLKSILRAQRDHEVMQEQAYIRNSLVRGSSGSIDEHGMSAKLAKLWNEQNGNVEPSQRILKLAAVLIHEQMMRRQSREQRKSLRRHANAVAARAAAAAAAASSSEETDDEEETAAVLRVRMASGARHKRALDVMDVQGNDADYNYVDDSETMPDGDVMDMFEDVAEHGDSENGGMSDGDDAKLDPTLLALRSDDEQLLRQMHGSAAQHDRYDGSVTELFNLAARHRMRKQRNREYLRDDWQTLGR